MSRRSSNHHANPRFTPNTTGSSAGSAGALGSMTPSDQPSASFASAYTFHGVDFYHEGPLVCGSMAGAGGGAGTIATHAMGAPDSSHHLGSQNIPLNLFIHAQGPWHPHFGRLASNHAGTLPCSTPDFRESGFSTARIISARTLPPSDSGYGTEARKSVGVPSIYGENDASSSALSSHLFGNAQFEHESVYDVSHDNEVDCSAVSWDQATLSNATAYSSPDTQPFRCDNCERSFQKQSELKKHVKITHIKPFACGETGCAKRFGTASDVARHERDVHKKAGTRYGCRHCAKRDKQARKWTRPDNFRNHLKTSHKIDIPSVADLHSYIIHDEPATVGMTPELTHQNRSGAMDLTIWPALTQQMPLAQHTTGQLTTTNLMVDMDFTSQTFANENPTVAQDTLTAHSFVGGQAIYDGHNLDWMAVDANEQHFDDRMTINHEKDDDMGSHTPYSSSDILTGLETTFAGTNELTAAASTMPEPVLISAVGHARDESTDDGDGNEDQDDISFQDHDNIDLDQDTASINMAVTGQSVAQTSLQSRNASLVPDTIVPEPGIASLPAQMQLSVTIDESDLPGSLDDATETGLVQPNTEAGSLLLRTALNMEAMDPEQVAEMVRELMTKLDGRRREEVLRSLASVERSTVRDKLKSTHPTQKPKPDCNVKCRFPGCDKVFQLPSQMKKHLKRHDKPYPCTYCDYRLGSKSDWKRHENNMHGQHELWKCDELYEDQICTKVHHRKEAFVHHLRTQHGIDGTKLEDKLVRCCVREGDPRFWCGFCAEIIDTKKQGAEASKARFNHIDDHYQGRNGLPVKKPEDWLRIDGESSARGSVRQGSLVSSAPLKKASDASMQLKKRSRDGVVLSVKRAKTASQHSASTLWECCQCHQSLMSYANSPSCIECGQERCSDCAVHAVALNEHV